MSRCFPFPPPGYVKKPRVEEVDLLKKEKDREKKHKKERRDKDKRDSKEKKEKDRSEGKHRDKKEKKEKHRDKKKDREKEREKERDREKDKSGTSEERRLSEQQIDGKNSKEKIAIDKDRPSGPIPGTSGETDKDKNRGYIPDERRVAGQSAIHAHSFAPKSIEKNQNIQKNQNSHSIHGSTDPKFVLELGKRVRDEAGVVTSISEKISVNDRKKDEGVLRLINTASGPLPDRKEKSQDRRGDDRRLTEQGAKVERKVGGTATLLNCSNSIQFSEGMPKLPKMSIEPRTVGREKIKGKESEYIELDNRIVLDSQRSKIQGKDKDRDREKKNDEKTKKVENRVYEEEKLRESARDSLDAAAANNIVLHVLEEVNKIVPSGGSDKKRKNSEPNGFLHENEKRQSKLPRPSTLSHPLVENGRVLEATRNTNQGLSGQGQLDKVKVDITKENKRNGILEKKPDPISSSLNAASLELLFEKEITGSPHPDLKYLGEVLTVPKFEELVPSDEEQDWLFGSSRELQEPREMCSSDKIKETPEVWSEAVRLESADIFALPYVVPF